MNPHIKKSFRLGFVKKAMSKGCNFDEAISIYSSALSKLGYDDSPLSSEDIAALQKELASQGYQAPVTQNSQSPEALNYNYKLLQNRDREASRDLNLATAQGGAIGGGIGMLGGYTGGHIAGKMQQGMLSRKKMGPRAFKRFPARTALAGSLIGAVAGGLPGGLMERNKVLRARKLQDPRNLQHMIGQMNFERQLAQNQIQ